MPVPARRQRHHLAIAAGSGITPVLSIITSVLEEEPDSWVTLLYGNRRTSSVMFLEELADLKNRYPERLQVVHVLSREPRDVELFTGRLDPERVARVLAALAPVETVDEWYLCGPYGMVTGAQEAWSAAGVDSHHVHHEVFHVAEQESPRQRVVIEEGAPPRGRGDGQPRRPQHPDRDADQGGDDPRRDAAGAARRSLLVHGRRLRHLSRTSRLGQVRMDRNYALEPEEVAAGVVLACQSHPVTDEVSLDYDA